MKPMVNGNQKRTRSERVAAVELPPGVVGRTLGYLRQGHILVRIGLCACASLVLWAVTQAWSPPLSYYEGYVPARDIHASIEFDQPDLEATLEARRKAGELAFAVYSNDDEQLTQLRARLMNTVNKVLGADSVEAVGVDEWSRFMPPQEISPKQPKKSALKKKTATGQTKLTATLPISPDRNKPARIPVRQVSVRNQLGSDAERQAPEKQTPEKIGAENGNSESQPTGTNLTEESAQGQTSSDETVPDNGT